MHVGLFIDTYYPVIDGVIKVVDAYATRLVKKCEVTVFTAKPRAFDPSYDERFPYKVERCIAITGKGETYSKGFPMFDSRFKSAIRHAGLDIIHVHSAYPVGLVAKSMSKKLGIPMVGTMHSHFKPDLEEYIGKSLAKVALKLMMSVYNACDECWAVNDSVGELFKNEYGLKKDFNVMPYSTEHYPLEDKESACREIDAEYGLGKDDFVLAHVGRIDFQKNEDFIVRSMVCLKRKISNFKLLFVGEGTKKKVLEKMIGELGLCDNVVFCGNVSEELKMMKIYARTDILLFPSVADTYGLVKVEAACQRTPTLFIKDTLVAGGVKDGYNGFLAENSEEAYAGRIEELYFNRSLIEQAADGAYHDIYNNWDDLVDNVYENYEKIIERCKFVK